MKENQGLKAQFTVLMTDTDKKILSDFAQNHVPAMTLGAVIRWAILEFIQKHIGKGSKK